MFDEILTNARLFTPANNRILLSKKLSNLLSENLDFISAISDLLVITDEWIDLRIQKSKIEPIRLGWNGLSKSVHTYVRRSIADTNYVTFTDLIRVKLSFTGDVFLLGCLPYESMTYDSSPLGVVNYFSEKNISWDVTIDSLKENPGIIEDNYNHIKSIIDGINEMVDQFNDDIVEKIASKALARRETLIGYEKLIGTI